MAHEALEGTSALPVLTRPGSPFENYSIKEIDKRVPEPFVFEGDRADFENWKMRLINRLTNASVLYPTEHAKLHYILSRTKGKGSAPIVGRMREDSMNHYQSAEEMIKDLTQAFGDYDATRRAERRRDDRSYFPMKENEDLEEYMTRFASVVNDIPWYHMGPGAERQKTNLFRQNLTKEIRQAVSHMDEDLGFEAIRRAAANYYHNAVEGTRPQNKRKNNGPGGGQNDSQEAKKPRGPNNTYRSAALKKLLRLMNACLRCAVIGHKASDPDAPCQGKDYISNKEAQKIAEAWAAANPGKVQSSA
ncbi:hypothetical protein EJ06DRAFT_534976 [Trichodelitschia bisporula]|uniref:Retrotransposon gag domain-containing protein n=1 Tax=Trichodelitschia bisporula TaxID=703511 RepID=A0A6G1HI89_9PEZI|nr:hypothetical protein EJ06DRAFT_534976 [Trichodelitschia bisporula]